MHNKSTMMMPRAFFAGVTQAHAQSDPLPSWNDGKSKQSIVEFVRRVTTKGVDRLRPARRADRRIR